MVKDAKCVHVGGYKQLLLEHEVWKQRLRPNCRQAALSPLFNYALSFGLDLGLLSPAVAQILLSQLRENSPPLIL